MKLPEEDLRPKMNRMRLVNIYVQSIIYLTNFLANDVATVVAKFKFKFMGNNFNTLITTCI